MQRQFLTSQSIAGFHVSLHLHLDLPITRSSVRLYNFNKKRKKNAHKLAKYHTVLYKSGTVVNTMLFRAYTEGPVGLHIHVTQAKSKSTALENTAETGRTNHSLM